MKRSRGMWIIGLAVASTITAFAGGYSLGQANPPRPACVDAHHSGVQAAKAALDGKRVCEGTR